MSMVVQYYKRGGQLVYSNGQEVEYCYWYQCQESHQWQNKNELVMLICQYLKERLSYYEWQ